jgi:hypothetical protein
MCVRPCGDSTMSMQPTEWGGSELLDLVGLVTPDDPPTPALADPRAGPPQTGGPGGAFLAALLLLIVTCALVTVGYTLLWMNFSALVCSSAAFASGSIGTAGYDWLAGIALELGSFGLLAVYCYMRFAGTPSTPGIEAARPSKAARFLLLTVPVGGLWASAMLALNASGKVYCAFPHKVLFHPSTFGSWRASSWDDVKAVRASCRRQTITDRSVYYGRRRLGWSYGPRDIVGVSLNSDLQVSFSDGESFDMSMTSPGPYNKASLDALRSALANKTYQYTTYNVSPDQCPFGVESQLLNWRK